MPQLASSDLGDVGRDSIAEPANLQEAGESFVTSSEDRQTDSAAWEQYRASRVENEPCTEPRSCPGMFAQQAEIADRAAMLKTLQQRKESLRILVLIGFEQGGRSAQGKPRALD